MNLCYMHIQSLSLSLSLSLSIYLSLTLFMCHIQVISGNCLCLLLCGIFPLLLIHCLTFRRHEMFFLPIHRFLSILPNIIVCKSSYSDPRSISPNHCNFLFLTMVRSSFLFSMRSRTSVFHVSFVHAILNMHR